MYFLGQSCETDTKRPAPCVRTGPGSGPVPISNSRSLKGSVKSGQGLSSYTMTVLRAGVSSVVLKRFLSRVLAIFFAPEMLTSKHLWMCNIQAEVF